MANDFPKILVRDSVKDMVIAVYPIDAAEMLRNGGARFSVVPWVPASVPSGQQASMQGGVETFDLAHKVAWALNGSVSR